MFTKHKTPEILMSIDGVHLEMLSVLEILTHRNVRKLGEICGAFCKLYLLEVFQNNVRWAAILAGYLIISF